MQRSDVSEKQLQMLISIGKEVSLLKEKITELSQEYARIEKSTADPQSIKGCPCCNGKAVRETTIVDDVIRCDWCDLRISRKVAYNDEVSYSVIAAWNKRPDNS